MTDGEFRHSVVNALDRIESSIKGDGTDANPGLCGVIEHLNERINYEEGQRKQTVMPRIQRLETNHEVHLARIAGKNQALTLGLGLLGGAGAAWGILQAL